MSILSSLYYLVYIIYGFLNEVPNTDITCACLCEEQQIKLWCIQHFVVAHSNHMQRIAALPNTDECCTCTEHVLVGVHFLWCAVTAKQGTRPTTGKQTVV